MRRPTSASTREVSALALLLPAQFGVVRLAFTLLGAAAVALLCAAWLRRRLGGYTGDALGATQQWTELAVYLASAATFAEVSGG